MRSSSLRVTLPPLVWRSAPRRSSGCGDAFTQLKAIGYTNAARPLLERAGLAEEVDDGVHKGTNRNAGDFLEVARRHRIWERESPV